MASTASLGLHVPPPSVPWVPRWTYDVFLSFRGEDTRKNFTDHLHAALIRTGIIVFRDDDRLKGGKEIGPELLNAIEHSRFAIVVMSQNYASSAWCLKELVKILQCSKEKGQTIFPIFYRVDPADVRRQRGSFDEAFAKHEKDNSGEVHSWRRAMTQFGGLAGLTSQDRHETELIKEIVKMIWDELSHTFPAITKDLVGMDSHVKKMNELFGEGLDDVRLIGICGMGGIGKSTIARVYYDRIRSHFEGSCFIDVKEVFEKHGSLCLQEQLLSQILKEQNIKIWDTQGGIYEIKKRLQHVKMLVILDNVDTRKQLEVLAVDRRWLYSGSRIIITSTDKNLLKFIRTDGVYDLECLKDDDALMLFRWKAFEHDQLATDYMYADLSRRVVHYANGLPLALEVLGSFLYGRSVTAWEDTLARLHKIPNKEIQAILQVSYDGLEELEKKIFLDIACFFKGEKKDRVTWILNCCGFNADIGLDVLIDESIISIDSENHIEMHDLLQAMGREIVRLESPADPGRRSRLWTKDDIFRVLLENKGGEQVEGIFLQLPGKEAEKEEPKWNMEGFSNLKNLRLLKINTMNFIEAPIYLPMKNLMKAPIYLSDELRFLDWRGYPSKSLPTCFHPDKLCELIMCHSHIQQLWNGIKVLKNLRILDLSHSKYLINTPDFTGIPNVEELILKGCTSLKSLHSSITGLKYLRILDLSDCCKLANVPENFEGLESLEKLDMSGTAIRQPPISIFGLKCLKELCFRGIKGEPSSLITKYFSILTSYFPLLPRSTNPIGLMLPPLQGLCSLTDLDLSYCKIGEGALPSDIGSLSSLKILNLSGNDFVSLPASINQLSKLWKFRLEDCKMLRSLTQIPFLNKYLIVKCCDSLEEMPDPINVGYHVIYDCSGCVKLYENDGRDDLAYTMLIRYIQGHQNPSRSFEMIIPGSTTPEWFSHETEENKIRLEMPHCSSILDEAECLGLAVCIPFVPNACWDLDFILHRIGSQTVWSGGSDRYTGGVGDIKGIHHLRTLFISSDLFRRTGKNGFIWAGYKAEGDIKVGRWGVRLVYRKDVVELEG